MISENQVQTMVTLKLGLKPFLKPFSQLFEKPLPD
jgi:hypothetical protein